MTPFPTKNIQPRKPKTGYLYVYCHCCMPDNGEERMAQCTGCKEQGTIHLLLLCLKCLLVLTTSLSWPTAMASWQAWLSLCHGGLDLHSLFTAHAAYITSASTSLLGAFPPTTQSTHAFRSCQLDPLQGRSSMDKRNMHKSIALLACNVHAGGWALC